MNIGEDLGDGARPDGYTGRGVLAVTFFRLRLRLGQSFLRRRRRPLPDRACSPLRRPDGDAVVFDTPADITALGTDDPAMRHGSHVGTIAGCYRGPPSTMGDGTVYAKSPFDGRLSTPT